MQRIRSEAMQPIGPGPASCRPLYQQFRAVDQKVSNQMNTSPKRSKEAHPTHSPSSSTAQSILKTVEPDDSSLKEVNGDEPNANASANRTVHHGWLYRRAVLPVLALMRMGASPERMAWSITVGFLIGINPLLGSTTILCLAVAWIFRLNIAASQVGNHLVYPLQLLLFLPFLHLGTRVFHTQPLPLSRSAIVDAARQHPAELVRKLWLWEWHALVLWAGISVILVPVIAIALTPLFRRLMRRIKLKQYQIAR